MGIQSRSEARHIWLSGMNQVFEVFYGLDAAIQG